MNKSDIDKLVNALTEAFLKKGTLDITYSINQDGSVVFTVSDVINNLVDQYLVYRGRGDGGYSFMRIFQVF